MPDPPLPPPTPLAAGYGPDNYTPFAEAFASWEQGEEAGAKQDLNKKKPSLKRRAA